MRQRSPNLDLKQQLITNTLIFKENLKILSISLIENIWKDKISDKKIDKTINTASKNVYKGPFEEIKELDEE